jgi:phosphatidylglycerophosphatase A
VLDEIIALPLCFAGWVTGLWLHQGELPTPDYFLSGTSGWAAVGVFAAFRVFDIAKPWPVNAAQRFPGGWGVTLDDVLAALYVNVAVVVGWLIAR